MADKVFAVHEGCRWEGGSTVAISKSYNGARIEAEKRVKFNQDENDEMNKLGEESEEPTFGSWKEERKDYWSDGVNIITINEFNLLP